MKKILLLSLVVLTFLGCSSDDDAPANLTSIVGTWKFYKSYTNGDEDTLDLCDAEETLIFTSEGDFSYKDYDENESGDCELDYVSTGTWTNTGSVYSITSDGETDSITITLGVDTFFYEDTETYDGVTTIYKEVYKKQ